jgi:hypothetical protein
MSGCMIGSTLYRRLAYAEMLLQQVIVDPSQIEEGQGADAERLRSERGAYGDRRVL